ncbi:MAG: hypothetical protein KA956_09760 [Pyrinomonadaceae bacterium]|nr:hypothetical protein [Acidobacteriota bacterium]MBK7934290.1 hypothetical protein [Acidobacteriota bacterium]MBP7376750.1 hypothetical protein [Pyrinomonadaceae bacterium]
MKQGELNKLIDQIAKPMAKSRGWKFSRGFIFRKTESLFFCLTIIGHAKSQSVRHTCYYKWLAFDDLFWKIVGLPENALQPLSFRAAGAWTAPMTNFKSGHKVLEELTNDQISAHLSDIFNGFERSVDKMTRQITTLTENLDFLKKIQRHHLEQYPGSLQTIHVQEMLTAILKGDRQTAITIAEERIAKGDLGGFMWSGGNFFTGAKQWVLEN